MGDVCVPALHFEPAAERRIQNRLKRIEGQVRGVQRLVSEQAACAEILVQIAALRQALGAVAVELIDNHLDTCVTDSIEKGDGSKALASLKMVLGQVVRRGA